MLVSMVVIIHTENSPGDHFCHHNLIIIVMIMNTDDDADAIEHDHNSDKDDDEHCYRPPLLALGVLFFLLSLIL